MSEWSLWRRAGGSVPPLVLVTAGLVAALVVLTMLEVVSSVAAGPDSTVLGWMLAHRSGPLTSAARAVTASGTSPLLYPLVVVTGVLVGLRTRRWTAPVAAFGVVVTGVLARLGLSMAVGDARPPQVDWLAGAHGFSYPSGHAATSALVAGTLAWLLTYLIDARWARLGAFAVLASWAVLVAVSRLYLGVHWVSDILGSWLLAGAWLTGLPAAQHRLVPQRRHGASTAT